MTQPTKIRSIFTDDIITALKNDKSKITIELLRELRSKGNEGKNIALEILDMPKDNEQYYLDAYGNRISFNGNRRLKKSFTKLNLSKIHQDEIMRCAEDIHYFKDNYVKIKTQRGINFPDLREYQNDFINTILPDEHENIVGLLPRQSGKSVTVAIYLTWMYNFNTDMNMGIVANKGPMAREFLSNVKNILIELPIWLQLGTSVWNKGSIENESKMRVLTDVPSSDSFRGFTLSCLVVDETAFIKTNRFEEFSDSIFPAQSGLAWKKNIIISTANGRNHFWKIVKGARAGSNGFTFFEVDWKNVPRYTTDGSLLSNEKFMKKIIDRHGIVHFNQNYGNHFVGSSYTLISADKLNEMHAETPEEIRDGKLNIYKYPKSGHKYVIAVDPSKDGKDAFAVQVIDITKNCFEQVASAKLQIDYLLMPEFLNEWGEFYNWAYLVIEQNEGAGQSIADQMFQTFEYENLHFDKNPLTNKRKKYPGTRTTTKSRKQILQTMKIFVENDKLKIIDGSTINELMQFILIKNKYQADDGAYDDMVMALALSFTPFNDIKNFEDMQKVTNFLFKNNPEKSNSDFTELLTIGNFDQGLDEDYEEDEICTTLEEFLENDNEFF